MQKTKPSKESVIKNQNYYQILSTLSDNNQIKNAKMKVKVRSKMGCRQKPVQQLTQNIFMNIQHEVPVSREETSSTSKDCITTTLNHQDNTVTTYCTIDDSTREEKTWRDVFDQTESHVTRTLENAMNTACENKYPGTTWDGEPVSQIQTINNALKKSNNHYIAHYTRVYLCKETGSEFSSSGPIPYDPVSEYPVASFNCTAKTNKDAIKDQNYFSPLAKLSEKQVDAILKPKVQSAKLDLGGMDSTVLCYPESKELVQTVTVSAKNTHGTNKAPQITSDCISKQIQNKQDTEQVIYCKKEDPNKDEKTWRSVFNQTEQHINQGLEKLLDIECEKKYPGTFWDRKPVPQLEEVKKFITNKHNSAAKYDRNDCGPFQGPLWSTGVKGTVHFNCAPTISEPQMIESRLAYTPNVKHHGVGGALAGVALVGVGLYSLYQYFMGDDVEKKEESNLEKSSTIKKI